MNDKKTIQLLDIIMCLLIALVLGWIIFTASSTTTSSKDRIIETQSDTTIAGEAVKEYNYKGHIYISLWRKLAHAGHCKGEHN